jgi:hypothetical protein
LITVSSGIDENAFAILGYFALKSPLFRDRSRTCPFVLIASAGYPSSFSSWATRVRTGLRFHGLRHQAITEMAEAGASDATLVAVSGHMSRRMLEHYSHVRMAAKRTVLDKLESGLMGGSAVESQPAVGKAWNGYVIIRAYKTYLNGPRVFATQVLLARWGSFSDSESGIDVTAIAVFLVEEMHTEVVDMILAATTKIR